MTFNLKFKSVAVFCLTALSQLIMAEEMEEIIVQGRLQSAAEALSRERMNEETVVDLLGSEMITRAGDTTVAEALQRVSGLSLVGGKFVYIRGLGERYSSSTLNGATIPSPDLTRNVIPLDIFPTSIVESLSVQKSYSVDHTASFGGGLIDIRTKGIPDSLTYSLELSGDSNSEKGNNLLSYNGGSDDYLGKDDGTRALSPNIVQSIQRFSGSLNTQNILNALRREGDANATFSEAQRINRSLALGLNRDISITTGEATPNWGMKANMGNNFFINNDWEVGFLLSGGYASQWNQTESIARDFRFPEERYAKENETTHSINLHGSTNFGVRYTDDHQISIMNLYLRSTDDEVAVTNSFNENREVSDGIGFRNERIKFEERVMVVNQIKGNHILGDATRDILPWDVLKNLPKDVEINWQYSESRAQTSIPNEVKVASVTTTSLENGDVLNSHVVLDSAAADYRFTTLDDEVKNYNWNFDWPFSTSNGLIKLSAGSEHVQKVRQYRQSQFSLGALRVGNIDSLGGALGSVFSDTNINDPANEFVFDLTGTNNQSYIAANVTDSIFVKIDWTFQDTWRVSVGARHESFTQVALDWNIYGFTVNNPQVTTDVDELKNSTFTESKVYPAVSLTYMSDWLAEIFQLRFGWSKTVVRPDLREITAASYIDPRTGFLTDGNPSVRPADINNIDLRAEWYFADGANFTLSGFYKGLKNPIEFFESAASDTNLAREIVNAESGSLYGLEIEGFKNLGFLGDLGDAFFIQSNVTLQKTELVAGIEADAPTNNRRPLAGASNFVVNFLIGFDSTNGVHAATLAYNVFGERLYAAGRNGAPDAFEQPFESLDMTYSWYPTESVTMKLSAKNILDGDISISREGIETFKEKPGVAFSASFQWSL